MWDIINFFLILILLLIILIVLITVIYFYFQIKNYVDETINHIGSSIPIFHSYEYTSFNYNMINEVLDHVLTKESPQPRDLKNGTFNLRLAQLCCSINMSSYNIYSDFESGLPDNIKHIETIGNNCFIYKIRKGNKNYTGRQIIISYRGTRTSDDVLTDLDSVQAEMSGYPSNILVHRGFYRLWAPQKDELRNFIKTKCDDNTTIFVTGHSLGCASAIFTSLLLAESIKSDKIHLYIFAPPRVGNHLFINKLDEMVKNNYAIINVPDIVPNLPFVTFPTIGNTWLYENFTNKYLIDLQMGYISLNHRLDTYMCGLDESHKDCKDPIWKKLPILTTIK